MAAVGRRLNTSQSEGSLTASSRLTDKRREKLMSLKKREELKDALTDKFKGRFGHSVPGRGDDECSVASSAIKREVDHFAKNADITEANLGRLERRLHNKATRRAQGNDETATNVSAYSGASQRSRSLASLTGMNVVKAGSNAPESFDWAKLDEYASYLHEQDALRQKLGVQALQRKLRMDLDQQVNEKHMRRQDDEGEEMRYHSNSMVELERWKASEQSREKEQHDKVMREKKDRDAQLNYERKLKAEESDRKTKEEASLVEKIVQEMESEQRRFERKKENTKKTMRKVFEENMDDQRKREEEKRVQMQREAEAMREYNRVMDEQEEQRAEELQNRLARQGELMKKLQENVEAVQRGAGDNDAQRASAQQEEMDRHFFEAENLKQRRLQQLKRQNQAYLLRQMEEKDMRKEDEKDLQNIQAQILGRDTQEYNEIEKQKIVDRRIRNLEHRRDIEQQMDHKMRQSVPEMSEAEIRMNKPLLELVNRTLETRDQIRATTSRRGPPEDDEDYE
uniref:Trichohyalin-plectin-homology domain-containing protein n=1 Tax=Alexandrium catenella TaxID=2925 RepID=A0A7S1LME6_ALECA